MSVINLWDFFSKTAILVTLIATAVGVSGYFLKLEDRIERIETQLALFAAAPSMQISAPDGVHNPLPDACSSLALRAADLESSGDFTKSSGVQDIMKKFGCNFDRKVEGK